MEGKPRLLDQVREQIRLKHYSIRTERVYCEWGRRFIRFHDYRHPAEMGAPEVELFYLIWLSIKMWLPQPRIRQLAALLFLYKEVLRQDLTWLGEVVCAKKPSRLPVVLSKEEVQKILANLKDESWLISSLLYGTGDAVDGGRQAARQGYRLWPARNPYS
jgi:site-specific recombinase XerD